MKKIQCLLKRKSSLKGFTIVELLIVVVIIAIIASITTAVYIGVTKNAHILSLKSDLSNASETLKVFKATHGSYPTTISCSTGETSTNTCVKASANNTYTSYTSTATTFSLIEKNNPTGLIYIITDSTNAVAYVEPPVITLSAISSGPCVITSNNKAYCWGGNYNGQLGNNSTTNSLVPVTVDMSGVLSGKTITSISSGFKHTCAIASNNKAYCWGGNYYGELGNNSTTNSLVPVTVDMSGVLSGKTITSISSGFNCNCAIASDNKAYCWGENEYGQLGNNSTINSSVPVTVDMSGVLSGKTITSISSASGENQVCAIASDNKAYCWGGNDSGELGNNSINNSSVPVAVDMSGVLSGKTITSISSGGSHTCAIASDNKAYCWGDNVLGQLGNNSINDSSVPVAVDMSGVLSGKTITSISSGGSHTCAIASDKKVYCWGWNYYGELGNNSMTNSSVPVAVDMSGVLSGKTITSISSGGSHTCAIASDNKVYCWGYNGDGGLGNNSTTNSSVPVMVQKTW